MSVPQLILSIIYVILAAFLVVVVTMQSGKSSGLSGAISGSSDSYSFGANAKSKTTDAKLAKWTKWVALAFVLLTLILNLIH